MPVFRSFTHLRDLHMHATCICRGWIHPLCMGGVFSCHCCFLRCCTRPVSCGLDVLNDWVGWHRVSAGPLRACTWMHTNQLASMNRSTNRCTNLLWRGVPFALDSSDSFHGGSRATLAASSFVEARVHTRCLCGEASLDSFFFFSSSSSSSVFER